MIENALDFLLWLLIAVALAAVDGALAAMLAVAVLVEVG